MVMYGLFSSNGTTGLCDQVSKTGPDGFKPCQRGELLDCSDDQWFSDRQSEAGWSRWPQPLDAWQDLRSVVAGCGVFESQQGSTVDRLLNTLPRPSLFVRPVYLLNRLGQSTRLSYIHFAPKTVSLCLPDRLRTWPISNVTTVT